MARNGLGYALRRVDAASHVRPWVICAGLPRTVEVVDTNGIWMRGTLLEGAETSELTESCTLDDADWSKTGVPTITEGQPSPDGGNNASKLEGITDAVYIQNTLPNGTYTNGGPIALGFWIKRISTTGTVVFDTGGGTGNWKIDLSGLPDRWVRITRESPYVAIGGGLGGFGEWEAGGSGQADVWIKSNDATSLDFHIFNICLSDNGTWMPGSDTPITTSAAQTRAADSDIQWAGGNNVGGGAIAYATLGFLVLAPLHTPDATRKLWEMSDGGSDNDKFKAEVNTSGQMIVSTRAAAGGTCTTTPLVDICINEVMCCILRCQENLLNAAVYRPSTGVTVHGTNNLSCIPADDIDQWLLNSINVPGIVVGKLMHFPAFVRSDAAICAALMRNGQA